MKCANFTSLSMVTYITVQCSLVFGRLKIESIAMSSHFHFGMLEGCDNFEGLYFVVLTC